MKKIRVVVYGASGRMGQEVVKAVCFEPDTQMVGAIDLVPPIDHLTLLDGSGTIPFSASLESVLDSCRADVMVDFSEAEAAMQAIRTAAGRGVNIVTGTTGLSADEISEIELLAMYNKIGIVMAPNFALGAVLMMHLAKIAGKYFDRAEIIELHHDRKVDSPSGTSQTTARAMAEARGKPLRPPRVLGKFSASRGQPVEGVTIHSVRLPGLMAHQEVILGGEGQTLRIRHDQINREAFMPGVILAVKEVTRRQGLIYGLDTLLGL